MLRSRAQSLPRSLALVLAAGAALTLAFAASPASAKKKKGSKKRDPVFVQRVQATLEFGARSGDFDTRAMAVEGLGYADKKFAAPILKDALEDARWQVRRAAIVGLINQNNKAWKAALAAEIANPARDAAKEVMPILESVGRKEALKLLLGTLDNAKFNGPDRWVDVLVAKGGDWLVEGFGKGLKLKAEPSRAAFSKRIGQLPLPDATPLYAKLVSGRKADPTFQKAILEQTAHAVDEVPSAKLFAPFLKKKAAKANPALAFDAAMAMARRGDATGKALLMDAAQQEDDKPKRLRALTAMLGIASKDMFPTLKDIVLDDDVPQPEMRADRETIRACYAIYAKVGNPKLAKHLRKRLMDVDLDRRAAAVRYLGVVGGTKALAELHRLLTDGAPVVRSEAARSIADLKQRESIEPIRRALDAEVDSGVKSALVGALAAIRDPAAVPVLRFQMSDPSVEVRGSVVDALAAIRHQDALPDLELALRDADPALRQRALIAIMSLGPDRHLSYFKNALGWIDEGLLPKLVAEHGDQMLPHLKLTFRSDRQNIRRGGLAAMAKLSKRVRVELAKELADKGGRLELRLAGLEELVRSAPEMVEGVTKTFVEASDPALRVSAATAIGDLGLSAGYDTVWALTDDGDEKVRVAAAVALLRI